jgi:hypothetical protein
LLKLGARNCSEKAVALTLNNDYWIYWETGTCTAELWLNGEKTQKDRIKRFQDLIVSLNAWGVPSSILPEFPKKRSLKKAVKGLKKDFKGLSIGVQNQEKIINNFIEVVQHQGSIIDQLSKKVFAPKFEYPTSAENAQVEKPIEFGCWVEVVNDMDSRIKGEWGVVTHEYNKSAFDVTFRDCTNIITTKNIKRIKSPIE